MPSCPRNITRMAAVTGSGEPRSVSRARQASIMQPRAAMTANAAPMTSYAASCPSAARTCGHWETSP